MDRKCIWLSRSRKDGSRHGTHVCESWKDILTGVVVFPFLQMENNWSLVQVITLSVYGTFLPVPFCRSWRATVIMFCQSCTRPMAGALPQVRTIRLSGSGM